MDLAQLNPATAAEKPSFLHLEHPATGEKLYTDGGEKIGIDLLGSDAASFQNARRRWQNQQMSRRNGRKPSVQEVEDASIEWLVAVTVKMHNVVIDGEEKSAKQSDSVYRENPWIREQVDAFVGDRANFSMTA